MVWASAGHSYKFCACISLKHHAGRIDCWGKVLWLSWNPCFEACCTVLKASEPLGSRVWLAEKSLLDLGLGRFCAPLILAVVSA